MSIGTSRKKLNISTSESERGCSPRVAAVLQALKGDWSQSSLAEAAEINRGVLNQLWRNQTNSSPWLIGRLCAVLDRADALQLLTAYLEDVAALVAQQQLAVTASKKDQLTAKITVHYPPAGVNAA